MLSMHGSGIGRLIAIGTACVMSQESLDIPEYLIAKKHISDEVHRLRAAIAATRVQMIQIRKQITVDSPPEATGFIEAHLMMLDDPMLAQQPEELVTRLQINAEQAIARQSQSLIDVFEAMEDEYLRTKGDDIRQVVDRIQKNLMDIEPISSTDISDEFSDPIIVSRDLAPADTLAMKSRNIRGILTNLGSPISHSSILARSLGIPAVVGLHAATRYIRHGDKLIVDGRYGDVIIAPDKNTLTAYRKLKKQTLAHTRKLDALIKSPSVTQDGERINLLANIDLPRDTRQALNVGASGIGLFRTEFLYLNRAEIPTESDHFNAYMRVIRRFNRQPITIRTMDLGADKQLGSNSETALNPSLGLRGIRMSLGRPSLFIPQLRAILRASAHGRVRMMIPMMSSLPELFQVLTLIKETRKALREEGIPFNPKMQIGGMIEVPAAAIAADLFAPHLDFFSIGTNDLIQYALAIDRVDDEVSYLYNPLHPSVLRLIEMTVRAANRAKIPVTLCGEMAGDPKLIEVLLGLGLRQLSMDPANLLEAKAIIRQLDVNKAKKVSRRLLAGKEV
ncbi:MAG: phosphoenolpyruvate--protein phosphotransferase [Gammaproteobacteria bacterium]|nr:phosphoenolpyruvate--protein phosphotransferase [Gammaproteobacteria bacterium]